MRRVAELYYEQNLGQQHIAKILGCSHSTVSRLLTEARETGVVQISIRRPVESNPALSEGLRKEFGLRDAIVVRDEADPESNLRAVGAAAADFLQGVVDDHMTVGITWGATLFNMVQAVQGLDLAGVEVIQLTGSLGQGNPEVDGPKLAIRLAELMNGVCRLVSAPAAVDDPQVRDQLMRQTQIVQTLERAAQADIMLLGIGALETSMSSLERAGYMRTGDREAALAAGAVGHICARMIDIEGREVGDYSERVISVPLKAMRQAMWSIGMSANAHKVPALLGALRGKYVNAVVMEETSAREVLRRAGSRYLPATEPRRESAA